MSLSLNNSTIVPLLEDEFFLGQQYDNILDFVEINISIKCDTGYDLTYIYSQDKLTVDYQTTQSISSQADTQFYKLTVKDRYFKLRIDATDGDMTVLNVQTIYKTSTTFTVSSGPSANVVITNPLNLDGSVFVGGSFDISGQTVVVDISGQVVDISGQVVDISGQTVLVDISGQSVNIGNTVDTDVYGLLNNQRLSAQVWSGVQVAQNETSASITPSLSSYCNTVLSCYGSSTEDAVIAVQFSNDETTFYTTQYQYTLSAGDFGFSIPCSALCIRLKLLSPTTSTLIAFINIC
jgi:hypothetical protein